MRTEVIDKSEKQKNVLKMSQKIYKQKNEREKIKDILKRRHLKKIKL